jgi:hypothetical protein
MFKVAIFPPLADFCATDCRPSFRDLAEYPALAGMPGHMRGHLAKLLLQCNTDASRTRHRRQKAMLSRREF